MELYQILSTDWVGEQERDEWLPCLNHPVTLETALAELAALIRHDVSCNVSYSYRIVQA